MNAQSPYLRHFGYRRFATIRDDSRRFASIRDDSRRFATIRVDSRRFATIWPRFSLLLATPLGLTPLTRRLTPLGLTPLGLTPLGLTPLGLTPLRWRADAPHRRPRLTPVAWPGADAPRPKLLRVFWHVGHFQSLPSTLTGCRWPLMFLRSWSSLLWHFPVF